MHCLRDSVDVPGLRRCRGRAERPPHRPAAAPCGTPEEEAPPRCLTAAAQDPEGPEPARRGNGGPCADACEGRGFRPRRRGPLASWRYQGKVRLRDQATDVQARAKSALEIAGRRGFLAATICPNDRKTYPNAIAPRSGPRRGRGPGLFTSSRWSRSGHRRPGWPRRRPR